jgi:hypothetical protein
VLITCQILPSLLRLDQEGRPNIRVVPARGRTITPFG